MAGFERKEAIPGTIDYLYWKNYHDRDRNVEFEEGPHIYTIAGYPRGESTSVTTWVHKHFSDFNAEEVATRIVNSARWKNDPNYKYYQI